MEKNIQSRFDNHFKMLFFKYLDEVITTNTIALEIQTCRLKCIISTTESLLIECDEPIEIIQQQYHRFITEIEIKNHQTNPSLIKKIQLQSTQTSPTTTPTNPSIETPTTCHLLRTCMNTEPLSVSSTSATSQTCITSLSTRNKDTTNKTTPYVHPTNIQNRKRKTTKEHPKGSKQLTLDYFLGKGRRSTLNNK